MAQGQSERNLAMVEMYAGGETLSAIGEKFGVTRERVRQILAKRGAVTAEDARRVRREARADELSEWLSRAPPRSAQVSPWSVLAPRWCIRTCTSPSAAR
ncbi:sigma factor-like helix-turn-helix DNA-binding protein [Micromonospora rifamycinica]|uniref:sigma factor-like helix-turn-helix DNA-binding protein n=1 Tax=Micromonospora rifamycinica TaxID=291594 RepID=UPI0033F35FF5